VIGNVVKRVIKFLKEEYHTAQQAACEPASSPQTPYPQTPFTPGVRREVETDFFAHGRPESLTRGQSTRSLSLNSNSAPAAAPAAPTIFDLLGHKGLIPLSSGTDASEQISSLSHLDFQIPSITPAISRASSVAHLRGMSGMSSPGSPVSDYEDFSRQAYRLKRVFTEAIAELLEEVDSVHQEIAQQASEHINSGWVASLRCA
jgi:hypothetical protein